MLFNGNVWNILDIESGFLSVYRLRYFFLFKNNWGRGMYAHFHNVHVLIFGYGLDCKGLKWDLLFIQ